MVLYKTKESKVVRVDGSSSGQSLKKFSTSITGDGVKTIFNIEHNLDTEDIIFEMYDGAEPALIDYTIVDKNNVDINFAIAPSTEETFDIKIYGVLESNRNEIGTIGGNTSTIDPSKIGTIDTTDADWNYTLDDANNVITLNYYTGSDTDVTVYSHYKVGGVAEIYKTQLMSRTDSDLYYMFDCRYDIKTKIESIIFSDDLDTSTCTNMSCMFNGCINLKNINWGAGWNTSNVTGMRAMFYNCYGLTSLDLSKFNTNMVTYMDQMFQSCSSLTELDLSNFDTSRVTNMYSMFGYCTKLATIKVSSNKWFTSQADTTNMFTKCGTSSVTYI